MNFNEYVENIAENAKFEALEDAVNLQEVASEVFIGVLESEGATHSEIAFAEYILKRYKDILNNILDDHFEVEYVGEIECNCDCDNCPCYKE